MLNLGGKVTKKSCTNPSKDLWTKLQLAIIPKVTSIYKRPEIFHQLLELKKFLSERSLLRMDSKLLLMSMGILTPDFLHQCRNRNQVCKAEGNSLFANPNR